MSWRGSIDGKDRFFGAVVYLLPFIGALPFGRFFLEQFPQAGLIYLPFTPIINIYYGIPFASLIIFFALFLAVVRNYKISHFIRFNTMQAILIDILLSLFGLILSYLLRPLGVGLFTETVSNLAFLGTLVAVFYSVIQSARGVYPEIPTISEAAYSQVP